MAKGVSGLPEHAGLTGVRMESNSGEEEGLVPCLTRRVCP